LVSGANKGIGLAICRRSLLDYEDVHVIMGCRSIERGEEAVQHLCNESAAWGDRLTLLQMDVGSDESVNAASATWREKYAGRPLYAICNNAGIATGSRAEILNVNTLGPKRVFDAFSSFLSEGSRVVQISSGAASHAVMVCSEKRKSFFTNTYVTWGQILGIIDEVSSLEESTGLGERGYGKALGVYGLSKALLNCHTIQLAREHPELKVNSCSPGMILTDIIKGFAPWWMTSFVTRIVARYFFGALNPDEGTVAPVYLLFDKNLEGNGWYYGSDAKRSPLDAYRSPGSPPYEGNI